MAIKNNQVISMQYELKVNGNLIESNLDGDSIEFVFGSGDIVPGLEARIIDMNEGESKDIKVPAIEAYGNYDENLSEIVPIEEFKGIDLQIGMILEGENENGELFKATVSDVTKENVTVDYNHPLAGNDLDFKIVINKIV
ncbi:FKBP-type peptidyl-prolyl cis-trans isomerase [Arcobacter aquimarinus]|uniref:Peptidyl-prolyl cis-trans isomerase n=1 Tax=Arcobacter aquimarinus TaxID=1315211 RepID=A0AAE7B598_9BACT|nr:FKBP-type peptidyl-prolyl cis-trans isomerase [Arcobacter aquimarinus]QKE26310.1 FKBP-type peptidyl-prolyl cis-trans isomerase [Arcobacter aquimarinus]RXI29663.1 peptidylprolyl isomerase [Arcobacter aquimarinus]